MIGLYNLRLVFLGEFLGPVIGGGLIDKYNNVVTAVSIFSLGALVTTILCIIAYVALHGEKYAHFDQSLTVL